MKPKVYIETTIPSYLTARPSRDLIIAAHQQITHEWWWKRGDFDLYVSRLVHLECQAGDPEAASARMVALVGVRVLDQREDLLALARIFHR